MRKLLAFLLIFVGSTLVVIGEDGGNEMLSYNGFAVLMVALAVVITVKGKNKKLRIGDSVGGGEPYDAD